MDPGTDRVVRIERKALSVDQAVAFLSDCDPGGVDLFLGLTRRMTGEKETISLEYDAYPQMALAEMDRVVDGAFEQWPLERVYVAHRIGSVGVGEISVVVGASAKHRDEAFRASRYLIDALKATVPIWKKESYADGTTEWKPELDVREAAARQDE